MRFWANLVGYQLVWFAIVISASRGQPWWGMAAALGFVALQLRYSATRAADARAVIVAFTCGFLLDGAPGGHRLAALRVAAGVVARTDLDPDAVDGLRDDVESFDGVPAGQALACRHTGCRWWSTGLSRRASRLRGAHFAAPAWHAISVLVIGWAIALATLAILTQRWVTDATVPTPQTEQLQ